MQLTGFVSRPDGTVAMYSSGAIGRLVAALTINFLKYLDDARKGRHYYTRPGHRFARPEERRERERASTVYSSDAPCGRHGRPGGTVQKVDGHPIYFTP